MDHVPVDITFISNMWSWHHHACPQGDPDVVRAEGYEFIVKTAEAKGLTLKEAARRALWGWATREGDLSWDLLFDLSKIFRATRPTDASKVDETLYRRRRR